MSTTGVLRLHLPAAALAALTALLALDAGGFHVRTFGWACLALVAWACVQAARGRMSRLRSAAGIAAAAFVALTAWTVLSISWADVSRHDAWEEGVRTLLYAAAFVLGSALLASARSFGRFSVWAGAAIGTIGVYTAARMAWGDAPLRLFVGGRLDGPIGYANGVAAFHLLGVLLLVGAACALEREALRARTAAIAARASVPQPASAPRAGRLRVPSLLAGLCLAGASACAMLAVLAQSRGSIPALLVALVVALVAAPVRSAWCVRLAVLAAGVLVARAALGDVFQRHFDLTQAPFVAGADVEAARAASLDAVREAGATVLAVSGVIGLVGVLLVPIAAQVADRAGDRGARLARRAAVPVACAVAALAVTLLLLLGTGDGSPIGWARGQLDACAHPAEQAADDPGSPRSHFSNSGTGRCDYYRVALSGFRQHPVTGLGAANFHGIYVRERRTGEEPRVAHSLPLQLLGELGIVGAALGAVVLAAVLWATWRFVRSGPARDAAFPGALAAVAYWLAHGAVDWLWQLPAVTLPVVLLMGGLVACVSAPQGRVPPAAAAPIAAGVLLAAVALVLPQAMADRALRQSRDPQLRERDPKAALMAAQDAARFDPSWAEPELAQGGLLFTAGHRRAAAAAGRRAVEREPRDWSVQLRASGLLALVDSKAAARAARNARRLNPRLAAEEAAAAADAPATEVAKRRRTPRPRR